MIATLVPGCVPHTAVRLPQYSHMEWVFAVTMVCEKGRVNRWEFKLEYLNHLSTTDFYLWSSYTLHLFCVYCLSRRDIYIYIYIYNEWMIFSSPLPEVASCMVSLPVDLFPLYLGTSIPELTTFFLKVWIPIFITRCQILGQVLGCYLISQILLKHALINVSSGFRREVAKNCALLGYYAAGSGNLLPTFRDNLSFPFLGFNRLSRIVGKKLSQIAA